MIVLLAVLYGYIIAMGSYRISGVGIFLMPITVLVYTLFTCLSQNRAAPKGYWIMYAAKFVFMIGLFLLSPIISHVMASL